MTIEDDIIIELEEAPRYFNELCRLLNRQRMAVYRELIKLERAGKVKSEMVQSSFETDMRWVRQFSLTGDGTSLRRLSQTGDRP